MVKKKSKPKNINIDAEIRYHRSVPMGWICPACNIGCSPWSDFCGRCATKLLQKEGEGVTTGLRGSDNYRWVTVTDDDQSDENKKGGQT